MKALAEIISGLFVLLTAHWVYQTDVFWRGVVAAIVFWAAIDLYAKIKATP